MSGISFGFEIAIGLVFGVIVTIRVLMFLRLVKYRRGNIHDAPPDLRDRIMRELVVCMHNGAEKATPEQRKEIFVTLMANMMEPWDEETYREITKTLAYVSKFDNEPVIPVAPETVKEVEVS